MIKSSLISISEYCEVACRFCFRADKGRANMDTKTFMRSLSVLSELDIKLICLTGGEPVHHKKISHFIKLSRQFGMSCSIVASDIKKLSSLKSLKLLHHATISIDSQKAAKYGKTNRQLDLELMSNLDLPFMATINYLFYDISEIEVLELLNTIKKGNYKLELSPLIMPKPINDKYIDHQTMVKDLNLLDKHFNLSDKFLKYANTLVSGTNCNNLCKSETIYISPKGNLRRCPYDKKNDLLVFDMRSKIKDVIYNEYFSNIYTVDDTSKCLVSCS